MVLFCSSNGGYQRAIRLFLLYYQENRVGCWIKNLATRAHAILRHHETSDTGQQQLVHQNSSSLDTSTPEIENISNNLDHTRPDYILYPSDWVNLVADPSLSPSYASRSATESAEYDQQSSISTYPPPTTFNVDAQRSDSMNSYDYYDLTHGDESPRSQSDIHTRIALAPYEEADASDPYSAWITYRGQVLSVINEPK